MAAETSFNFGRYLYSLSIFCFIFGVVAGGILLFFLKRRNKTKDFNSDHFSQNDFQEIMNELRSLKDEVKNINEKLDDKLKQHEHNR